MGVQVEQESLIPVYEEAIVAGFDRLAVILDRIEQKLSARRKVSITSDGVIPTSVQVRDAPIFLQVANQVRITLTNRGANTIYLGPEGDRGIDVSHSLLVGESFTIDTRGRIWVFTDAAGPERLDVLYEVAE